jgi:hypothetical protein
MKLFKYIILALLCIGCETKIVTKKTPSKDFKS